MSTSSIPTVHLTVARFGSASPTRFSHAVKMCQRARSNSVAYVFMAPGGAISYAQPPGSSFAGRDLFLADNASAATLEDSRARLRCCVSSTKCKPTQRLSATTREEVQCLRGKTESIAQEVKLRTDMLHVQQHATVNRLGYNLASRRTEVQKNTAFTRHELGNVEARLQERINQLLRTLETSMLYVQSKLDGAGQARWTLF